MAKAKAKKKTQRKSSTTKKKTTKKATKSAATKKTSSSKARTTKKTASRAKLKAIPKEELQPVQTEIAADAVIASEVEVEDIPAAAVAAQAAAGVEPVPFRKARISGDNELTLTLSSSLAGKLQQAAEEEGIDVASFAHELLAEGVVLRAWEIIERKSAMRGGNSHQNHQGGGGNFNGGGGGGGNRRNRNRNRNRNNNHNNGGNNKNGNNKGNWMDDRASFLEYVRNQEKRNR